MGQLYAPQSLRGLLAVGSWLRVRVGHRRGVPGRRWPEYGWALPYGRGTGSARDLRSAVATRAVGSWLLVAFIPGPVVRDKAKDEGRKEPSPPPQDGTRGVVGSRGGFG